MSSSHSPAPGIRNRVLKVAALVVVAALLLVGAGLLALRSVEKAVGDFSARPGRAAALKALQTSADFDLIHTDDATGTVTVRHRKTAEEVTVSFEDAAKGNFQTKAVPEAPAAEDAAIGKGAPPAWVPAYPGAIQQGDGRLVEKQASVAGAFSARSADSPVKVKAFFESRLKEGGFEVESTVTDGKGSAVVSGKGRDDRTLMVLINAEEAETSLVVNYEGPKE